MSNINTVKAQLQALIDNANATTGKNDLDLTSAHNSLINGYGVGQDSSGSGGSGGSDSGGPGYTEIRLQEKTVTENGVVTPDPGYDGLSMVIVDVETNDSGDSGGTIENVFYPSVNVEKLNPTKRVINNKADLVFTSNITT